MILEFGFKNYFGFKEGVSISFVLDNNCPESVRQGRKHTNVLCIKGANASGKTNILRGLSFIMNFCAHSFFSKPEALIPIESFFYNKAPSEFYIKFQVDGQVYRYELSTNGYEVLKESFVRGRKKILERNNLEITKCDKEFEGIKRIKIRRNASLVSLTNQYEIKEMEIFYTFFSNYISNVNYSGYEETPRDIGMVSEILSDSPALLEFTKRIISNIDTGVQDIKIIKKAIDDNKNRFDVNFLHFHEGQEYPVFSFLESSGTKTLFRELPSYKLVLDSGGLLVVDEFGANLHPDILPKLLALFLNVETNPNDAQLIIATHDNDLLDELGRYRTYLVNKENNESYAYRLDEIPGDILRNDRPIAPVYRSGKIGGVPKL